MAQANPQNQAPEVKEFIKEVDQRVYDFCCYMLDGGSASEEVLLTTFRYFSDWYRRHFIQHRTPWDKGVARVKLFQIAWEAVQEILPALNNPLSVGRDMRQFQEKDTDLIQRWETNEKRVEGMEALVRDRIWQVDATFRAPVVLRDVLGFSDDEVVEVLQVRWGVYRHRLHRGRLEMMESLKGRDLSLVSQTPSQVGPN